MKQICEWTVIIYKLYIIFFKLSFHTLLKWSLSYLPQKKTSMPIFLTFWKWALESKFLVCFFFSRKLFHLLEWFHSSRFSNYENDDENKTRKIFTI